MSLKDKIKTPDKMVDQQGAKLLIYGQAGAGKTFSTQSMPGNVLLLMRHAEYILLWIAIRIVGYQNQNF